MMTAVLPVLIGVSVSLLVFLLLQKISGKKKSGEPLHREFIRRSFWRWRMAALFAVLITAIFSTLTVLTYFDSETRNFGEVLIHLTWYGSIALMSLILFLLAIYLTWYYYQLMKKL